MTRLLPHGPLDLLRQVLLLAVAYAAYSVVRGLADDPSTVQQAFENGRSIIELEQALGVFVEPAIQSWAAGLGPLLDAASWVYLNAQTSVMLGALAFVYLRHNERFRRLRDTLLAAMALALAGYALLPTAPPRMFPEWGFSDSVAAFAGVDPDRGVVDLLLNQYAAVPSMHVAFALIVGLSLASLVRHPVSRAAWRAYPVLVTFVIVATANHFVLDAAAGALVAALATACAALELRAVPAARRPVLS